MAQPLKVLIVDDEPGIRKLVADILRDHYSSVSAGSTQEALAMVADSAPDLVLSDVKMPGPDGLVLLEKMTKTYPKIPVILMTGHGDKEMVIKALRTNAFDYIEKPFEDEVLVNTIKRAAEYVSLEKDLMIAQTTLIQSSRMASLGEMAGGIAHEINTPLGTISLVSEQMQEILQEDPIDKTGLLEMANIVGATTKRIASIIQGLRTFSRDGSQDKFAPAPLKKIIEDTLYLCGEKIKHNSVKVSVDPIPDDLLIECRPNQISQVVLNLLGNACDAIGGLSDKWIKISLTQSQDDIHLVITDSGAGIPENVRNKLFQPFFTTKDIGKGTGLGLSISKGLIEAHHGTLAIESSSKNTCFVIRLPRSHAPQVKVAA